MKFIILIGIALQFLTCNANKSVVSDIKEETITTDCPENGTCSFDVLLNSILVIKEDGIGALYPEIKAGNKTVLKFEYKRHSKPNTVDGDYSEIIYAEIEAGTEHLQLENKSLSKAKLLYGRLCFCRGESGYALIEDGNLIIEKIKDQRVFKLAFKCKELPQIIESVTEVF